MCGNADIMALISKQCFVHGYPTNRTLLYERSYQSTSELILSFLSIASRCTEVLCHHVESQCPLPPSSMTSHCYPSHEANVLPFLLMSKAGLTFYKCRTRADQAITQSCICQLRTQSILKGSFARSPTSAQLVRCSIQCIDIEHATSFKH